MKYLKIAFIFGSVLLIFAGCSKEEIQPDPFNIALEAAYKSAKEDKARRGQEAHKLVPFMASFELVGYFQRFGPIYMIDEQTDWPFGGPAPGMHVIIRGNGNATHLGKTEFEISQWWTRMHPSPPPAVTGYFSYGQGGITFTAANGDELYATYWGWADHQDDLDGTEILTHGIFIGGTGKFDGASGTFLWDGLFMKSIMPVPPTPGVPGSGTPLDTEFGVGNVTVSGSINYRYGHGKGNPH